VAEQCGIRAYRDQKPIQRIPLPRRSPNIRYFSLVGVFAECTMYGCFCN